jgi:hypothetical protein
MRCKSLGVFFVFLLLCSGQSFGSESNGKVIDYWIHYVNNVFAFSIENQTGRPACATFDNPSGRYVVDTSTNKGKVIASAIIAAKVNGTVVHAWGADTCNYYGDSEDLMYIQIR